MLYGLKISNLLCAGLCVSAFFLLSCTSSFDSETSLGGDVLKANDPSLTDINQSIKLFPDGIPVDAVNSYRLGSSILRSAGLHFADSPGVMTVGNFLNEEAIGYMSFDLGQLRQLSFDSAQYARIKMYLSDSSKSCVILLPADHTVDDSVKMSISACKSKLEYALIDTTNLISVNPVSYNTIQNTTDTLEIIDSLFLDSLTHILDTSKHYDSTYNIISFAIRADSLIRFANNGNFVFSIRTDSSTYCSIKPSSVSWSVFEKDSAVIADSAISSANSERMCIFKLNLAPLWNYLDSSKYTNIIGSRIAIAIRSITEEKNDNSQLTFKYGFYGSDSLKNQLYPSILHSYPKVFSSSDTISLPLYDYLKPIFLAQRKDPVAYLYLTVANTSGRFGRISWLNQPKLKTSIIFSNPQ